MDLLKDLTKTKNAKSRSICAENFTGEKGVGGSYEDGVSASHAKGLGQGWKVSPCIYLHAHEEFVLADIKDSGTITHFWCTCFPTFWRKFILKVYWDGSNIPSIQVPIGDFFCNGWCERSLLSSIAMTVNPAGGFNSYFQMPFKKEAKFVLVNNSNDEDYFYYQIDYELEEHNEEIAYFHAFWQRAVTPYKGVKVILPRIHGKGHYVGTYLAWQVNNNNWWGEGEVKFYLDGDKEFPTICGTGTEDYFGGAWNFEFPKGEYCQYSTPYQGLHQVIKPNGLYKANMRFGMYRWHLLDPVRFTEDLEVTIQDLGWRADGRYLPQQSDIASVAYWYQTSICENLAIDLDPDKLEVI